MACIQFTMAWKLDFILVNLESFLLPSLHVCFEVQSEHNDNLNSTAFLQSDQVWNLPTKLANIYREFSEKSAEENKSPVAP